MLLRGIQTHAAALNCHLPPDLRSNAGDNCLTGPYGEVEWERQRAEGSMIKLGNAPWVQLRNGHAKTPGSLPPLSNNLGESYAPTSDPIQARLDRHGCPVLAGDEP